eukprot:scaffold4976_cov131-Isochrysis_galbana.AAC.10
MGDPALYPEIRTARFIYAMQHTRTRHSGRRSHGWHGDGGAVTLDIGWQAILASHKQPRWQPATAYSLCSPAPWKGTTARHWQ